MNELVSKETLGYVCEEVKTERFRYDNWVDIESTEAFRF